MDNASVETSTADWSPNEQPQVLDVGLTLNAILKIIFYIVVMIIGTLGNSLILRVFWPKHNKTSTQVLIMGLAGMDLTVCLMRVYNLTVYIFVLKNKKTPPALGYLGAIALVNVFASSVLTGLIALDRYDCVCRPNNRLLNRFRAKMMILSAYAGAMLFASPRILEVIWLPATRRLQKTFLTFQFVLYILVLGVICVCYGRVYMAIRKHVKVNALSKHRTNTQHELSATTRVSSSQHDDTIQKPIFAIAGKVPLSVPFSSDGDQPSTSRRPENTETSGKPAGVANDVSLQRKTTRMMFGTSVVLLVTWFPYWLYVALLLSKINGSPIPYHVLDVVRYTTISVYVNNILNPLIYGVANRRFRKDCLQALKKMRTC
ncbi:neuropeptide Y receptor type 2-like [Asterias amurensis]|uniref:neuropeptide Y receptor type 2-like n=1 Tax=Asterias amurensis TaxID=7602 RepID=UPI003AB45B2D